MTTALERWIDRRNMHPYRDLARFEDKAERLINNMLTGRRSGDFESFDFTPSCDISEDDKNFTIKFDLPGTSKDQIRVEADNNLLTVHAERREEKEDTSKKHHLSEIYYGSYTRSFSMPGPVDEKKIAAKFDNGVLTLTVPKTEGIKSKQIPIQ